MTDWFPKFRGVSIYSSESNEIAYHDLLQFFNIDVGADIVVIGDLGLWNGRRIGYKELNNPTYSMCFESGVNGSAECEWLVDNVTKDLCAKVSHHDGTNYYLYRKFKDISDVQRANFLNKIYEGTVTRGNITRLTSPIGKDILELREFAPFND